jgi:hypothetical protein
MKKWRSEQPYFSTSAFTLLDPLDILFSHHVWRLSGHSITYGFLKRIGLLLAHSAAVFLRACRSHILLLLSNSCLECACIQESSSNLFMLCMGKLLSIAWASIDTSIPPRQIYHAALAYFASHFLQWRACGSIDASPPYMVTKGLECLLFLCLACVN